MPQFDLLMLQQLLFLAPSPPNEEQEHEQSLGTIVFSRMSGKRPQAAGSSTPRLAATA